MTEPGTLRSRLARGVVAYVTGSADHPFARVLDAVHVEGNDIVDLELEIAVAQDRRVAIEAREPVRLIFSSADDAVAPFVLSIRVGFPVGEVHTSLERADEGLSLCVWEEGWQDLSRTLTGQALVERLRFWFAGMADGSLHQDGQAPEPLIPAVSDTIVFPPGDLAGPWSVASHRQHRGGWVLRMERGDGGGTVDMPFAVFHRVLPTWTHGALSSRPTDMGGLRELCRRVGFDVAGELRAWLRDPAQTKVASRRRPLFVLLLPKSLEAGGEVETIEPLVFATLETLAELGGTTGSTFTLVEDDVSTTAPVIGGPGLAEAADGTKLFGWRIVQRLDRSAARVFAGSALGPQGRLVAVGGGAIGSNVVLNATHAGMGPWTVIDDDVLLPHNLVRQTQTDGGVGEPKAALLAAQADAVLAEAGNEAIVADVLAPGAEAERIAVAMREAEMVVDFSASPSVVCHLADAELSRAASFFFGPDGSDLVALDEGPGRMVRLDEIEAQYFLAVAMEPGLEGHLASARTDMIRYANACRDLSRPLPPWQVQTLSGIATGELQRLLGSEAPAASVWRLDPSSGAVLPVSLVVGQPARFEGAFRLSMSPFAVATMRLIRAESLPDETGGILIGTYDLARGIVHVLAALPAPADSRQAPSYFVRGAAELGPLVERLAVATAGRLQYVGEWHSHPDGAAARPSTDDEGVFEHLVRNLDPVGAPYVMAICGDAETWFRAGWRERGTLEGSIAHDG